MKKVLALFLLGLTAVFATMFTTQAAEGELIDLYPYDQEACLEASAACTKTKLGNSYWDMEYAGHRYHFVRQTVRMAHMFTDGNADGFYMKGEFGGALAWNAFAVMTINDTAEEVVLTDIVGQSARTSITDVVHRMYSYFDETGKLQMFEDHISAYYIFNDGTPEAPDWRLATAAEAAAWDAAATEAKPVTTRNTHIRMKLDATDSDGYKLEPLYYLTWRNADVAADAPVEQLSTIIAGDPNYVTIPAGWTVVSFGTNDRDSAQNAKTVNFIKSMPTYMLDNTLAPMQYIYTDQAPLFGPSLAAADDDATNPGINMVIDYNSSVALPNDIVATYVDMYDAEDKLINLTKNADYQVIISLDDTVLETITYTYDTGTSAYVASAPVTVIDSMDFGAVYKAVYRTVNPEFETLVTEVEVDIVIGVMPPKYIGVADRFIDENTTVDVLEGIIADNGYGVDISDLIEVTLPGNLNVFNPQAGEYTIELEFTYNVFIEGISPTINLNGTVFEFTGAKNVQEDNFATEIIVYDDVTNFKTSTFSWGSSGVFIEVGGDGKIIRTINRNNWDLVDENGLNTPANAQTMFPTWLADLTLEDGGYLIAVGRSTGAPYTAARALLFDQPVSYDLTLVPDVDEDFVKTASYVLTVDDKTSPVALVVNDNYQVIVGEYTSVDDAILANVVAFDNFDDQADIAMFVSDDDDLDLAVPGTYTVEVTLEDAAGNATVVSFDVVVVANAEAADIAELEALIDDLEAQIAAAETANGALADQIAALQTALEAAQAAIDALEAANEIVPDTGCGSAINTSSAVFMSLSILLGAALIVFLKRRR
jgi:uncharacterized coiled-coil protein SlyX